MVDATGLFLSEIMGGLANLGSSYNESLAMKEQSKYDSFVAEANARILRMRAEDSYRRGELNVLERARAMHELEGAQTAAYAAQGVDVNTGTPAHVRRETRDRAYQDILRIRENAAREAFGFKVEALNVEGAGRFARIASKNQQRNTMQGAFAGFGRSMLQAGLLYNKYNVTPNTKTETVDTPVGPVPKGYTDDIDYMLRGDE